MRSHACLTALALLLLPACSSAAPPAVHDAESATPSPDATDSTDSTDSTDAASTDSASNDSSSTNTGGASRADAAACDGGVVYDDGDLESGYGFVPSAEWGTYLQAYDAADFASRQLETVCVCWLRTREVDRVDFEIVFHRDAGGRPAAEPYARRPATAEAVPKGKEAGGRFYAVDVTGVELPEGRSYIGVRFDPGAARFSFVCADHSPTTRQVPVFQQEDRAPALLPVIGSRDPVFAEHRAMMLRAKAAPPAKPFG